MYFNIDCVHNKLNQSINQSINQSRGLATALWIITGTVEIVTGVMPCINTRTYLYMTTVVHGSVEGAVTYVAGDVQGDVVETEADDAPTPPVPVELRIVGGAPHRDVEPAKRDAQIPEENLVDDLDLDTQSIESRESLRVGLERHDTVAGDITRVDRNVYLTTGERL